MRSLSPRNWLNAATNPSLIVRSSRCGVEHYSRRRRYHLQARNEHLGSNTYGNASQPYSFSRTAKKALKESREIIAHCIGAAPEEIFFTSGGTESDNWAIKGSAFSDADKRATITSMIEHHAILKACESIERLGYPVAYLPVDSTGTVQPGLLSEWITDRTRLVSII